MWMLSRIRILHHVNVVPTEIWFVSTLLNFVKNKVKVCINFQFNSKLKQIKEKILNINIFFFAMKKKKKIKFSFYLSAVQSNYVFFRWFSSDRSQAFLFCSQNSFYFLKVVFSFKLNYSTSQFCHCFSKIVNVEYYHHTKLIKAGNKKKTKHFDL